MDRRGFIFLGLTLALSGSILVPVAGAEGGTGSDLTESEVQKLLDLHNQCRAEVGVAALTWSPKLATFAQSWADQLAATGQFKHGVSSYGENLAGAGSVEEAVGEWLREKAGYRNAPTARVGPPRDITLK